MNILLISPKTPDTFWSFKHTLGFLSKKAAFPPLGLLTVAAMLPRHWSLRVVDMNVQPLSDQALQWADYVMISAMIVHQTSVRQVAARCQAMGKPVIGGGPLFTTGTSPIPGVDHVVQGEAEEVMPQVVADLEAGRLKPLYASQRWPDLAQTPIPRWDLVRLQNYTTMSAQFSRGCPFDCEFCDIVAINGRVPRTKTPEQLIAELDTLRRMGWEGSVFIVDDNFIGNRRQTRSLLQALVPWRRRTRTRMTFITEASVNLADDPELCELMVRVGFKKVFVGLETPATESLEECHKLQNRRRDLAESVRTLQRAGLEVMGGFIIGFDNDPMDIFRRQFEFIQRSGVVTAMVGLLTALPQTRLYQRLKAEGRLLAESTGNNTEAALNFITKLNRDYLITGYRQLMQLLYDARTYYQRACTFLENHRLRRPQLRLCWSDLKAFLKSLWLLGVRDPDRWAYWRFTLGVLFRHPRHFPYAIELAVMGHHFRRVAQSL